MRTLLDNLFRGKASAAQGSQPAEASRRQHPHCRRRRCHHVSTKLSTSLIRVCDDRRHWIAGSPGIALNQLHCLAWHLFCLFEPPVTCSGRPCWRPAWRARVMSLAGVLIGRITVECNLALDGARCTGPPLRRDVRHGAFRGAWASERARPSPFEDTSKRDREETMDRQGMDMENPVYPSVPNEWPQPSIRYFSCCQGLVVAQIHLS